MDMMSDARPMQERTAPAQGIGTAILCAFFVSGVCGLLHQIVWTRLLRHVMGNDTFAITTVLCAFMGGLALGSYAGGRLIDRRRDALRVFAILEGAIALYCLLLPTLIDLTEPIYVHIYRSTEASFYTFSLLRFIFSGLLLLLPATMMGATLPILTRFLVRSPDRVGWPVGTLYGVNTFGAVAGAAATGFLLLPSLGLQKTIYLGCLLNFAVCTAGLVLFQRARRWTEQSPGIQQQNAPPARRSAPEPAPHDGGPVMVALLVGYGFSGLAALVYEIAWTRVLSLMIGSSVYAFSLMLTAFILGLAAGSVAYARFADRARDPLLNLGVIEMAIGLSALCVVPIFGQLPFFVTDMIAWTGESFWLLQLTEFALVLLIMLVPTTLMGAAFPLAARIAVRTPDAVGRSVGKVYGCNTLGSIVGAFAGGFVLIPALGIQYTIVVAVAVNVLIGCLFFGLGHHRGPARGGLVMASVLAAAIAMVWWIPCWDAARLTIGPFMQAQMISRHTALSTATLEKIVADGKVLYHNEGISTTLTVKQYASGERTLFVNGKPDASSHGDLPTQILSAHLPLLFHPDPDSALVIGLASGITLGSAGLYPVRTLDCVEIAPAMIEACHFFDAHNHQILSDPRARVIIADGRNHLALSSAAYDVIISEPSNPWIAGIGDLFTREFFDLCRRRLTNGGLALIWFDMYNNNTTTFGSVIHTFRSVFPYMSIWNPLEGDYLLIGSETDLTVDHQALARRMARPEVAEDLARIGIETVPELLGHLVIGGAGAERISRGAPMCTDDNGLVEFSAPRALIHKESELALLDTIEQHREADLSFLSGNPETLAPLRAEAAQLIEAKGHLFHARRQLRRDRPEAAIRRYRLALLVRPNDGRTHFELAALYKSRNDLDLAIEHYTHAARLEPDDAKSHNNLGTALAAQGRLAEAMSHYRRAIKIKPDFVAALLNLGVALERNEQPDQARIYIQEAVRLNHALVDTILRKGAAW